MPTSEHTGLVSPSRVQLVRRAWAHRGGVAASLVAMVLAACDGPGLQSRDASRADAARGDAAADGEVDARSPSLLDADLDGDLADLDADLADLDGGPAADAWLDPSLDAAGGALPDAALAPTRVNALVRVIEDDSPAVSSLTANAGPAVIYERTIDAEAGDRLRIMGQVEITNDYLAPVNVSLTLTVDGSIVGNVPTENVIVGESHHMPLWVDAVVVATGRHVISLHAAAARSDASPVVTVEGGYGHLVIEHYREFASREAARAAGARLLARTASSHVEAAGSFGGTFGTRVLPYTTTVEVGAGDLVRVLGMATSVTPSLLEMHGHAVFVDTTTQISPWSTKNGHPGSPTIPLLSDGTYEPPVAATSAFSVSTHGVAARGGDILAGGGGIDVLVFSSSGALAPSAFAFAVGPSVAHTANAGSVVVASAELGVLRAGEPVRIAAHVSAVPPEGYPLGIACVLSATLDVGAASSGTPLAAQYVTPSMGSVALALRTLVTAPADGTGTVRAHVSCSREGESPVLTLTPTVLVAEAFTR